jgi:hypothetical protein
MTGKTLDVVLICAWAAAFAAVSMFVPGIANFLVGWGGGVALLWYNSLVRHDPADDSLRPRWLL